MTTELVLINLAIDVSIQRGDQSPISQSPSEPATGNESVVSYRLIWWSLDPPPAIAIDIKKELVSIQFLRTLERGKVDLAPR